MRSLWRRAVVVPCIVRGEVGNAKVDLRADVLAIVAVVDAFGLETEAVRVRADILYVDLVPAVRWVERLEARAERRRILILALSTLTAEVGAHEPRLVESDVYEAVGWRAVRHDRVAHELPPSSCGLAVSVQRHRRRRRPR